METILIIALIVVAVACLVATTLLLLQKRELANLVRQLDFIRSHDTRARLTLGSSQTREMRQMARAINALIEQQQQQHAELVALDTEMRHAVTNISHDLRTPLTSAVGYLQLLEGETLAGEPLDDEARRAYTATARAKLESLTVMLDQLMAFSRLIEQGIEQRGLELEQVNLSSLLRTSLAVWYDDLRLAGFEVKTDIPEQPVLVIASSEALQRIIQNLVGNALTHGHDLLRISLLVGKASEAGAAVSANMSADINTGADMGANVGADLGGKNMTDRSLATLSFTNRVAEPDALQAERLFNRFYTSDVSRSGKGTGLGLAIVRSLATAYGGSASIHQEGDLLTISVSLPVVGLSV